MPKRWKSALASAATALASHRGWDEGALALARRLAWELDAPLVANTWTRLLADANRSATNGACFSQWTQSLPTAEREQILDTCWRPHRDAVQLAVLCALQTHARVLHVSLHSFTPRFDGQTRSVDVGWLYDPARVRERDFAKRWRYCLTWRRADLCLRFNQPYKGTTDGLTRTMRRAHDDGRYLGIELEVNQRLVRAAGWGALQRDIVESLKLALSE